MKYGIFGVIVGSIAMLLAVVHFWAGPFTPQPTIETSIAEKAVSIRNATLNALQGKEPTQETHTPTWTADKMTDVATATLGGLALIFAVVSFILREPMRIAASAAALGGSAIAFQFVAMYAMALLFVLLVCAVLSSVGLDDI